jgi:hypothetical protein
VANEEGTVRRTSGANERDERSKGAREKEMTGEQREQAKQVSGRIRSAQVHHVVKEEYGYECNVRWRWWWWWWCVCVCVCVCVCSSLTLAALEHPKIVPRVTLRDQLVTRIHLPFLKDLLVASGAE